VIVVSPAFDDRLLSAAVGGGESESSTGGDGVGGGSTGEDTTGEETTHNPTTSEDTGSITLIRAAPSPASLPGWVERTDPALVVAATDDSAVNDAAEAAALAAGALINRTDVAGERDAGSVVVPATVDDGPVRVAISTGGQSPALSKVLRQRISAEIEHAGEMATLSGTLREELKADGVPPDDRRRAIRRVVRSTGVWKGLQKGRSYAKTEADNVIEEVVDR